jgi:uncharacterized surface protein with fasciclin (FAS1) repeats
VKSIAEIASRDKRFQTLVEAASAAGLVETLAGEGPFTLFAPTDEAFTKLPEGTVESLLNDKVELSKIVLYHLASRRLAAADLSGIDEVRTAQGGSLKIAIEGDVVMVGDARVLIADIEASNGIIHVIDTVLLP